MGPLLADRPASVQDALRPQSVPHSDVAPGGFACQGDSNGLISAYRASSTIQAEQPRPPERPNCHHGHARPGNINEILLRTLRSGFVIVEPRHPYGFGCRMFLCQMSQSGMKSAYVKSDRQPVSPASQATWPENCAAWSILRGGTLKNSLRTSLPAIAAALLLTGIGPSAPAPPRTETLYPQVLRTYPHDRQAFTQGLELVGSRLYESTGGTGTSDIRFGPLSGPATLKQPLDNSLFGEGITRTGAMLWQLTWKDGIAIQRSAATLTEQRRVTYSSEGWGVCHQPHRRRLLMSDGTSGLQIRDPSTFALLGTIDVLSEGSAVRGLNELECVGDDVYANVWPTDSIVRIDSRTGYATAHIDASSLLTPQERRDAQVLNGIAYRPETGTFLLTGKHWPKIFEVTFAPPGQAPRGR